MTYKCKGGGSCELHDLPHDFPLLCVCSSIQHGKIVEADLDGPRELKRLREELAIVRRDQACLNAVAMSVAQLNEVA